MLEQIWRNMPQVVKNLLLINLMMFVGINILNSELIINLSLHYFDDPGFEPFQVVSHMFMHANFPHLFFNMFTLLMFGSILERLWGPKRFLIFYLIAGLGGAFLHEVASMIQVYQATGFVRATEIKEITDSMDVTAAQNVYATIALGASGAIFGLMVAFAMLFPNTELMLLFLPIPVKAKYFIPFMILGELFLSVNHFEWDNIAHYGHLGGALLGFIMVKLWNRDRNKFY